MMNEIRIQFIKTTIQYFLKSSENDHQQNNSDLGHYSKLFKINNNEKKNIK